MITDTLKHVRLAKASEGDDLTFSRYVKVRHARKELTSRKIWLPGMAHPSIVLGRTLFRKGVKDPTEMPSLLVSGHSNIKIGRDVRKGRLKGYWLYTLSLEERATCPSTCHHWQTCYGNNMPFAKRIDHTHPEFLPLLAADIERLLAVRGRVGILVRLHALGDFYSTEYVQFWREMLQQHPQLSVFGYTARRPGTPIGDAVQELARDFADRAMIRVSDGGMERGATVSIMRATDCPDNAFVCPEQQGKVDACGKCGVCWSTLKNVAFLEH